MGRSVRTYEFRNETDRDANDLHVTWGVNAVEVIGVGGVSPDAPDAKFTLEETGGRSNVSEIDVDKGDSIKVRMRTPRQTSPPKTGISYFWTKDGKPYGRKYNLAAQEARRRGAADDFEDEDRAVFVMLDERLTEFADRLEAVETVALKAGCVTLE